jgi:hypothetical protein
MKGWKTWAGAAIIGFAGTLQFLDPSFPTIDMSKMAEVLLYIGGSLGLVGVAHKIEKAKP